MCFWLTCRRVESYNPVVSCGWTTVDPVNPTQNFNRGFTGYPRIHWYDLIWLFFVKWVRSPQTTWCMTRNFTKVSNNWIQLTFLSCKPQASIIQFWQILHRNGDFVGSTDRFQKNNSGHQQKKTIFRKRVQQKNTTLRSKSIAQIPIGNLVKGPKINQCQSTFLLL